MRLRGDAGTALISAWFTLPVILVFLLFATQLAFAMYTTTMVEGIAFDAAYDVASADARDNRPAAQDAALADANARAPGLEIQWSWLGTDDDYVELAFVVENPTFLPDAFAGTFGFGTTERSVRVRTEEPRS
jgi:hypothetical protein